VTVRRSRTVAAPVDDVWRVVRDPHHLPRWWPKTQRVEAVSSSGWTSVMVTERGRTVRADYRVELSKASEQRRWAQELPGTPFERLFTSVVTELTMAPAEGGTLVGLETRATTRGFARFGGFMVRRAMKRQLEDALGGLAALVEAS
jgi:uncharacterized protein YndB with AHSA1/START domain